MSGREGVVRARAWKITHMKLQTFYQTGNEALQEAAAPAPTPTDG
jgi:hypothetical protein